jgi:hypothetical protein
MGCNRSKRLSTSFKASYACWDIINEIQYDKGSRVFYRIVGRKKMYVNFLSCKLCKKYFVSQCLRIRSSECFSEVQSFVCPSCIR